MSVFATVLHDLKSPVDVGTIVRSHVAFGGAEVVFVGLDRPWRFKKSTQAFSRRLERLCAGTVVIPQFGDVSCLNAGVSCAIAP